MAQCVPKSLQRAPGSFMQPESLTCLEVFRVGFLIGPTVAQQTTMQSRAEGQEQLLGNLRQLALAMCEANAGLDDSDAGGQVLLNLVTHQSK